MASGQENRIEEVTKGFEAAKGMLRKQLADSVDLRFVPELAFYHDDKLEQSERVEDIFRRLELEREEDGKNEK